MVSDRSSVNVQAESSGEIPRGATVLVVEDNVANFVLIARMLGYMGIHCEWKTSGYEVVEYADTLPQLDLILMDIRLPYEDGYAALKKIRSSPNGAHWMNWISPAALAFSSTSFQRSYVR